MQATWIRNSIMHALRKTLKVSVNNVSSNVVYEHPNIGSLARYVFAIVNGDAAASETTRKAEDIVAFLARYTSDFAQHVPSAPASEHDVVLVTGTTGALGSALLARLVGTESSVKI
jgi:hydrogenase maturation factor